MPQRTDFHSVFPYVQGSEIRENGGSPNLQKGANRLICLFLVLCLAPDFIASLLAAMVWHKIYFLVLITP